MLVRDSLAAALRERLDTDFIDPAKTAVAGVSPASITNGADDHCLDRRRCRRHPARYPRAVGQVHRGQQSAVERRLDHVVSNNAVALAMMTNPLGQPEFGSMTMTGGTLSGMPVIASDYVGDIVVLLNASRHLSGGRRRDRDRGEPRGLAGNVGCAGAQLGHADRRIAGLDVADQLDGDSRGANHQLAASPRSGGRVSDGRFVGRRSADRVTHAMTKGAGYGPPPAFCYLTNWTRSSFTTLKRITTNADAAFSIIRSRCALLRIGILSCVCGTWIMP